jgi:hypothetical protein
MRIESRIFFIDLNVNAEDSMGIGLKGGAVLILVVITDQDFKSYI